ncbi:MAG: sigma-70 family RNA polymerase sigma factor [Candidatus Faecousia sp.]|nr:sigma-70 family RNA polymerase sigma factor [Clostridiales bacterium]MDD5882688.1 sigma-70 family RNA polymerase sigma factor [Bacillota bacterium]MDY4598366.1 sigma-70 family RNA polymerase sigma factor [Candidatus Faecousia sp.]
MRRKKNTQSDLSDNKSFFLDFYEENKGFLFFTAKKYANDPSEQEDIVQDTILRLLRHISTLRTLDKNRSLKYIALTVRSSFLDHERKKHNANVLYMDDQMLEALLREEEPAAQSNDPITVHLEVMTLRQSLPARDWMVLEGRYLLGYSYDELAEQLGLTPENTRMIVSRAKEKARRLLLSTSERGGSTDAG